MAKGLIVTLGLMVASAAALDCKNHTLLTITGNETALVRTSDGRIRSFWNSNNCLAVMAGFDVVHSKWLVGSSNSNGNKVLWTDCSGIASHEDMNRTNYRGKVKTQIVLRAAEWTFTGVERENRTYVIISLSESMHHDMCLTSFGKSELSGRGAVLQLKRCGKNDESQRFNLDNGGIWLHNWNKINQRVNHKYCLAETKKLREEEASTAKISRCFHTTLGGAKPKDKPCGPGLIKWQMADTMDNIASAPYKDICNAVFRKKSTILCGLNTKVVGFQQEQEQEISGNVMKVTVFKEDRSEYYNSVDPEGMAHYHMDSLDGKKHCPCICEG